MTRAIFSLLILFFTSVLPASSQVRTHATSDRVVQVQMGNVRYHFTQGVEVSIRQLRGELVPTAQLPVFDDKNSFTLHISSAEISITSASLANVLNSHVLNARTAPIKDISVRIEKGHLKVKGKLHSKGDIPFETDGTLSVTSDGKLRLHAEKIKAFKLPIKGLMDLLGIEISDLIKSGKARGLQPEGDDLILDPEQILPPPHIEGKVIAVRLEGNNIVQVFGGERREPLLVDVPNYMAYRSNQLRFGKLTMSDTDMILIDLDPKDAFDFSLEQYQKMLTAGYTKVTASFGLRVYMRDVNKLPHASSKQHP